MEKKAKVEVASQSHNLFSESGCLDDKSNVLLPAGVRGRALLCMYGDLA